MVVVFVNPLLNAKGRPGWASLPTKSNYLKAAAYTQSAMYPELSEEKALVLRSLNMGSVKSLAGLKG